MNRNITVLPWKKYRRESGIEDNTVLIDLAFFSFPSDQSCFCSDGLAPAASSCDVEPPSEAAVTFSVDAAGGPIAFSALFSLAALKGEAGFAEAGMDALSLTLVSTHAR